MSTVPIHKAKTELSRLIERVLAGEEIVIARGSVPVVRLVPVDYVAPARRFGALKDEVVVDDSFFEPLPEDELAAWER